MKIPSLNSERIRSIFSHFTKLQHQTESYSVKAIPNQKHVVRASIIAGKKELGKVAVMRNRADRRIRAALRDTVFNYSSLKGYDLLFFARAALITKPWPELLVEMNRSFKALENKINSPTK